MNPDDPNDGPILDGDQQLKNKSKEREVKKIGLHCAECMKTLAAEDLRGCEDEPTMSQEQDKSPKRKKRWSMRR